MQLSILFTCVGVNVVLMAFVLNALAITPDVRRCQIRYACFMRFMDVSMFISLTSSFYFRVGFTILPVLRKKKSVAILYACICTGFHFELLGCVYRNHQRLSCGFSGAYTDQPSYPFHQEAAQSVERTLLPSERFV